MKWTFYGRKWSYFIALLFHENAEHIYCYSLSNQVFRLSSLDIILGRKGSCMRYRWTEVVKVLYVEGDGIYSSNLTFSRNSKSTMRGEWSHLP